MEQPPGTAGVRDLARNAETTAVRDGRSVQVASLLDLLRIADAADGGTRSRETLALQAVLDAEPRDSASVRGGHMVATFGIRPDTSEGKMGPDSCPRICPANFATHRYKVKRLNCREKAEADDEARTRDLRLGKPTLYQLSYIRVSGDSRDSGFALTAPGGRMRPRRPGRSAAESCGRSAGRGLCGSGSETFTTAGQRLG
jgi:hypothetical protein